MGSNQRVDMTAMNWRPPLVRLTQIGNPDVANGEPTVTYIAADQIGSIRRLKGAYAKYGTTGTPNLEFHPGVECTEVNCCHFAVLVTETPDTVAMLRDRALGHEPEKPKSAK